jgi:hypothetical protein
MSHAQAPTEAQGDALCLASDAKVAAERAVALLLHRHVDQRVLSEDALSVEVCREEAALAILVVDVCEALRTHTMSVAGRHTLNRHARVDLCYALSLARACAIRTACVPRDLHEQAKLNQHTAQV